MALGDDVYDTHIAIGLISRRGGGDNLNILDICSRNLLQRLRTLQRALLAIDIDEEARTTTERHATLGIHANRRGEFQHINSRTARCGQRRRAADTLAVEFIYNPALLARNDHLLKTCFSHCEGYPTQIDTFARCKLDRLAHIRLITNEHNGYDKLAVAHAVDSKHAIAHGSCGHAVVIIVGNHHVGKLYGFARCGVYNATRQRRFCLRKEHSGAKKRDKCKGKFSQHR